MPIAYSAAIFFALVFGGLLALRRLPPVISVTTRVMALVVLSLVCYRVSLFLARRWGLNLVELGFAWAVALLPIIAIEAFRHLRKKQSSA